MVWWRLHSPLKSGVWTEQCFWTSRLPPLNLFILLLNDLKVDGCTTNHPKREIADDLLSTPKSTSIWLFRPSLHEDPYAHSDMQKKVWKLLIVWTVYYGQLHSQLRKQNTTEMVTTSYLKITNPFAILPVSFPTLYSSLQQKDSKAIGVICNCKNFVNSSVCLLSLQTWRRNVWRYERMKVNKKKKGEGKHPLMMSHVGERRIIQISVIICTKWIILTTNKKQKEYSDTLKYWLISPKTTYTSPF